MFLKRDVISASKGKLRGSKGDKVKIIFTSSPAAIVEGKDGERYPTTVDNLSESFVAKNISEPLAAKKTTKTKSALKQKQLF